MIFLDPFYISDCNVVIYIYISRYIDSRYISESLKFFMIKQEQLTRAINF